MGSKSKIAADLIRLIPSGRRFVDVFAGGCAMTHAALLAGRWEQYLMNDITEMPLLFCNAVRGVYRDEKRWISREDFNRLKDTDPYVKTSWSFGNSGHNYLYSEKIEPYKRACHYAVVLDDWEPLKELCPEVWSAAFFALRNITNLKARRLAFGPAIVRKLKALKDPTLLDKNPLYASCHKKSHPNATYLERLEHLERLERLQSLESLESQPLQATRGDYRKIEVRPGDIIYCDPPYKGTAKYQKGGFDHEAFYDWVEQQTVPVYISEFDMPRDRFMCVWEKATPSRLAAKGSQSDAAVERLFVKRPKTR